MSVSTSNSVIIGSLSPAEITDEEESAGSFPVATRSCESTDTQSGVPTEAEVHESALTATAEANRAQAEDLRVAPNSRAAANDQGSVHYIPDDTDNQAIDFPYHVTTWTDLEYSWTSVPDEDMDVDLRSAWETYCPQLL